MEKKSKFLSSQNDCIDKKRYLGKKQKRTKKELNDLKKKNKINQ